MPPRTRRLRARGAAIRVQRLRAHVAPAHRRPALARRRRARCDRRHAARRAAALPRRSGHRASGRSSRPATRVAARRTGRRRGCWATPWTRGCIGPGTTVIESTSGNMGVGLAQACRYHGLRLICVVDSRAHDTNVRTLRALGADVRVVTRARPADRRPARRPTGPRRASCSPTTPGRLLAQPVRQRLQPGRARRRHDARDRRGARRRGRLPVRRDEHDRDAARLSRLPARARARRPGSSPSTPSAACCSAAPAAPASCPASVPASRPSSRGRPSPTCSCASTDLDCVVGCRRLVAREAIFAGGSSGAVACALESLAPRAARRQPLRAHPPRRRRRLPAHGLRRRRGSRTSSAATPAELAALVGADAAAAAGGRLSRGGDRRRRAASAAASRSSGSGPKGLFALERLLDHARGATARRVDVDLFEPHPAPGAGPVYDPAQPAYLRMNLAAEQVDLWWPLDAGASRRTSRRSFDDWRRTAARAIRAESYPPRAEVGRYLADGLARLLRHAPPERRGRRCAPVAVRALERCDGAWAVTTADDDVARLRRGAGRRSATGPRIDRRRPARGTLGARSSPSSATLDRDRVPAGATVAVRGFALTFIDAALALTEGRGGTFEPGGRPHRLRYRGERRRRPSVILPFSRSGTAACSPSPTPRLAAGVPALDAIAAGGRATRSSRCPDGFSLRRRPARDPRGDRGRRAWPRPAAVPTRVAAARAWLAAACDGAAPPTEQTRGRGARALRRGRRGRCGRPTSPGRSATPGARVYPALVERLGGRGLRRRAVARVPPSRRADGAGGVRSAARQRGEAARARSTPGVST